MGASGSTAAVIAVAVPLVWMFLAGELPIAVQGRPWHDSTPLLAAVFDHAERREFVYEHVWRVGDLLLWDNRCSSHARTDFPSSERRLMLRTTVKGTVRPY